VRDVHLSKNPESMKSCLPLSAAFISKEHEKQAFGMNSPGPGTAKPLSSSGPQKLSTKSTNPTWGFGTSRVSETDTMAWHDQVLHTPLQQIFGQLVLLRNICECSMVARQVPFFMLAWLCADFVIPAASIAAAAPGRVLQ
jgi:hypothetical protein